MDFAKLARQLTYTFSEPALLKQAVTHRSASGTNNERMEFLGDSILNLVISEKLYHSFPDRNEGELSRLRAHLVREQTLHHIANQLNLGEILIMGRGELKSGGHKRASILADAVEAIFAAIYFDSDFNEVRRVILYLFTDLLADPDLVNNLKDSKTMLQEYMQAQKAPLPVYELVQVTGSLHDPLFHVTCTIKTPSLVTQGKATTRRAAEQSAARKLLAKLK